jgi:hypothetical protein
MSRRIIVNSISGAIATLAAIGAAWASVKVMNMPKTSFFAAVLILSALVVWIFVFFLVWGHFQESEITAKKADENSAGKSES